MYKSTQPLYFIMETPLHAGSGSDLGYIDLPIQRERHTGYPKVESSGVKGAIRQSFEAVENIDLERLQRVFGYDGDGLPDKVAEKFGDKKDFAGALGFSDARILLFPVKSLKGTFAWVTCHRVLAKFRSELEELCGEEGLFSLPESTGVASDTLYLSSTNQKIQLEEYIYSNFEVKKDITGLANWIAENVLAQSLPFWQSKIKENLIVLPEDDFADFLKFSTEVHTRIKIDNDTGTVKDGALFTEEYLPSETVMYSLAMFSPEFKKDGMKLDEVRSFFNNHKPDYFQMGGNSSIGKGIVRLTSKNGKE
jgi:CRISPR-associated protein Cmr4